jgi:hypothetical protein
MKYEHIIIKLRLTEIQLLAVVRTQLQFSIVKDHRLPSVNFFETLLAYLPQKESEAYEITSLLCLCWGGPPPPNRKP